MIHTIFQPTELTIPTMSTDQLSFPPPKKAIEEEIFFFSTSEAVPH
jgi:hypothetical protein